MKFTDHLARIKSSVRNVYSLNNLDEWICKHTYLNNEKYSFKDHEFQLPILKDSANTTITVKCAQVGLSELSFRYAIAACCTQENFTVIYTMPTSGDAEKANNTRIGPMIQGSPEVKRLVDVNLNNSEIKKFGDNSFIFFRGTKSATQALSIPADVVINDEWDASDTTQASVYVSRLQHKETKVRKIFSTPTIDKYGVSLEAQTAKRYRHISQCVHCNHMFLPDYFEHVKIPGCNLAKDEINKRNLHTLRWREAYLACPKCGKDPELHHTRQRFVCENDIEPHAAHAYYVSPFSAPNIISMPYLVQASTLFMRFAEFKNQVLGLTAEEKSEAILEEDLDKALINAPLYSSELHVMGSDIGITCHISIGRVAMDETLLVVHREKVHYTNFEARVRKLSADYRVVTHVIDTMPYTDMVTRICNANPHSWGAMFVNTKTTLAFSVQQQEEDTREGKMDLRLVKVNRTVALDQLLGVIKAGEWKVASLGDEEDKEWKEQMLTLKRVSEMDKNLELQYMWVKTGDESDHFHFSLLYLYIATKLRGMAGSVGSAGLGVPLVRTFRIPA